jgi:predicted oxidoreductase
MKTYQFPHANRSVSSVVLGLMRINKMSDAEIQTLFGTARDAGIDVFDHADIYGGERHFCEKRFGEAISLSAAEREAIVIQSKVGIRKGYFDFSKEHILATVDESLAALKTDYLDVLLLHRPDTLVEPEDVAAAFDTLHAAGKVRNFGVSNHTPGQIELLKTAIKQPLMANQVQLSITHAPLIAQGIAANMAGLDQSISRDVGLLDYSRLNGMMLQAWSPFQKGFFDGVFIGDKDFPELNTALGCSGRRGIRCRSPQALPSTGASLGLDPGVYRSARRVDGDPRIKSAGSGCGLKTSTKTDGAHSGPVCISAGRRR